MVSVEIYTSDYCAYCVRAKNLLERNGISYSEIKLENNNKKYEIMTDLNWRTIPIIVINKKVIGGYDQLLELERSNKLEELVN